MMENELPGWISELIKQAGPFAVILAVLFWYVPRRSVSDFIAAQQAQAVAMSGIKDALNNMADKGDRLDEKIDVTILNQRLMVDELKSMKESAQTHRAALIGEVQSLRGLMLQWTRNILAEKSEG